MSFCRKKDIVGKGLSIETRIHYVRGQKVILDADLANIYGVTTKRLNEQVKRNLGRFPSDFMFCMTMSEYNNLKLQKESSRSQFATLKRGQNIKYLPHVFTENGAIMAANVLNSASAVRMSVFVVRAFMSMRAVFAGSKDLAKELVRLEKKLTGRLDVHEMAIVDILKRMMELLEPPLEVPVTPKHPIGFHAIP